MTNFARFPNRRYSTCAHCGAGMSRSELKTHFETCPKYPGNIRIAELEEHIRTKTISVDAALEITKRAQELMAERDAALSELAATRQRLEFAMNTLTIIDPRQVDTFKRGGTVRIYDTVEAIDAARATAGEAKSSVGLANLEDCRPSQG